MSAEQNPSRSAYPTQYEVIGFSDEWASTHHRSIPMSGPYNLHVASQPGGITLGVNEDEAIQHLLKGGSSPGQIVEYVNAHKASKDAGNHRALDIISEIPKELLMERIHTFCDRLPPTVATPLHPKLEPSEDSNMGVGFAFERIERAPITPERKPPRQKLTQRGCPGDQWTCKPIDLRKRATWSSFKLFREHYTAYHLEDHRRDGLVGGRAVCRLCNVSDYPGDGHELAKHIFFDHLGR